MLHDICFEKLCNFVEHIDKRLEIVMSKIKNSHNTLFTEIFGKI